jgi:hypothetical protein
MQVSLQNGQRRTAGWVGDGLSRNVPQELFVAAQGLVDRHLRLLNRCGRRFAMRQSHYLKEYIETHQDRPDTGEWRADLAHGPSAQRLPILTDLQDARSTHVHPISAPHVR